MTCFECGRAIQHYPCACGYQPKALAPVEQPLNWIIQQCCAPGCTLAIRVAIGDQDTPPICKWHRANTAYTSHDRTSFPSTGPFISKEEFGLDLFNAISAQAGLRQAERTAEIYERKGMKRQAKAAQDQVKALQHELTTILDSGAIEPTDLKRILEIT